MEYSHPAKSSAGIIELHSTFPIKTFGNFFASKYKFQSSCCDFGKKLPRMLEKNWRLHQNWTLSARGVSHEEVFFQKMTWSWYTFTSAGRPPARVSKVIYTCFEQCFEEKRSFRKNYICIISLDCTCKKWCFVVSLLITSGQWTKNLQFSGKKDSAASSKLHCILRLAGKSSTKKIDFFCWKNYNVFFCLWVSARKILVMDEKYMVALLDLLSTCPANMSRILVKLNIFSQLSGFEQNEVGLLVENFPQDCRKYIIRVQKIIFRRGLLCGWKIFPKFFWIKGVSYLQFWRFFFGMVAKHEFNLSSRRFGENNFWEKSLRFCHNVWTISKNDLVCWREKNYHFVFLTIKFRISWKNFAGSWELNSARSRFCFERNNICWAVKNSWWNIHIRRKVLQG